MDALAALRERVDLLEEQFRQFRDHMAPKPTREGLNLTQCQWILLDALRTGRVCSWEHLLQLLDVLHPKDAGHDKSVLRVHLCNLRKVLMNCDPPVRFETYRGLGCQMSAESMARLATLTGQSA